MCSSWNDSRSLYTDRSGSRMLPNSSELKYIIRRNYLESNFYRYSEKFRFRERRERVLFFYNGKGTVYFQIPKLRNAPRQRPRPTKERKLTCACSVCHTLHTTSYDLPIGILQTALRQLISLWKHHWWRVVITALLCWSSVNLLCRR